MQGIEELKFRLQGAKERLAISERALKGKLIKAPVSGQVIGLEKQTIGSVITPAEKIMDIVPADELLLIEVEIQPNLIDRISVGDDVDISVYDIFLNAFFGSFWRNSYNFKRYFDDAKKRAVLSSSCKSY